MVKISIFNIPLEGLFHFSQIYLYTNLKVCEASKTISLHRICCLYRRKINAAFISVLPSKLHENHKRSERWQATYMILLWENVKKMNHQLN